METVVTVDWEGRARALALATIAWNVLEGVAAVGFGVREDSVALWGFGLDSWVEVGSAGVGGRGGCARPLRHDRAGGVVRVARRVARRLLGRLWLRVTLVRVETGRYMGDAS